MTNPVAVKCMSRAEIESLMYTTSAESGNQQAELFEALVRRLLEIMEQDSYR